MTDRSQRLKLVVAAAGISVGVFLIAKYHKEIYKKLSKALNKQQPIASAIKPHTKLQIEIVNDPKQCGAIIDKLRSHCEAYSCVLGFDTEWVTCNNQRRKIALIQLCSADGYCALFRVCKFVKIPDELKLILEDPDIIKAGITPISDAKYLLQDYAIKMNGTFDLRFLAVLSGRNQGGLAKLSKSILDVELNKDWHIRCSDWEAVEMNDAQVDYAAKDAFVAIEIFKKLYNEIRPTGELDSHSILRFCDNYTDITFKNKMAQLNLDPSEEKSQLKMTNGSNNNNRVKNINKIIKRGYGTRATPLYDNCLLEAPDGALLCTCDRKRASWYIKKELGNCVADDPFTVRLNFEPAGRAVGEVGLYYQSRKENRCVVCGKEEELIRKNVVPHEYRKFFPEVMKDKTSHDVLLLCSHCHQLSNIGDIRMRQELEEKCQAPLHHASEVLEESRQLKLLMGHAKALLNSEKIPEARKTELHNIIQTRYPNDVITKEFLEGIMKLRAPKVEGPAKPTHAELVVLHFKENEGLITLERMWRQHFLDCMQPRHLPELWNVNHNANRLEIRATEGRVEAEDLKVAGVNAEIVPKVVKQLQSLAPFDDDNSSELTFRSAASSRNSHLLDKTLTDDSRSFYETVHSESSTLNLDDFLSCESSLTERPLYDSDGSGSSFSSQNLSMDDETEVGGSDTEVEEVVNVDH